MGMGRYYRLSKKITEEMASEILTETLGIEDVQKAEFLESCDGVGICHVRVLSKDKITSETQRSLW